MPESKRRKRFIDANSLERYAVMLNGSRYVPWLAIAEVPEELPETAGKWIRKYCGEGKRRSCSRCGFSVREKWREYQFCPRCGVRMEVRYGTE